MLVHLTVRDFTLVDSLEVAFGSGLTVITGESGAGKSILVEALALVLGARASKNIIRLGAARCEVIAEFDAAHSLQAQQFLTAKDLVDLDHPHECIVRRIISSDGRSRTWVNSVAVNVRVLRELCAPMVEVHGQFEQQQLLNANVQLEWFDDYGVDRKLKQSVRDSYRLWRDKNLEYEDVRNRGSQLKEHRAFLSYQANELKALSLGATELDELTAKHKRLSQAQDILSTVSEVRNELENGLADDIAHARQALEQIDDNEATLESARKFLNSAEAQLDEARIELRNYSELVMVDEYSLTRVGDRLTAIHDTARKLGIRASQLGEKTIAVERELNDLILDQSREQKLAEEVRACKNVYRELAAQLSAIRHKERKSFESAMCSMLAHIGLPEARVKLEFQATETENGLERVEFLVTANSKYPPQPIRMVASGGELSRISLAIQIVAAEHSNLPCLILDEADIGVGGVTADTVGRLLRLLANKTQVVCVTHAPQVAALGGTHLHVFKSPEHGIAVLNLDTKGRIQEIARMVGGREITEETRDYAKSLLGSAEP